MNSLNKRLFTIIIFLMGSLIIYSQDTVKTSNKLKNYRWTVDFKYIIINYQGNLRSYKYSPDSKYNPINYGFGLSASRKLNYFIELQSQFNKYNILSGSKNLDLYFKSDLFQVSVSGIFKLNNLILNTNVDNKFVVFANIGFGFVNYRSILRKYSDDTFVNAFGYSEQGNSKSKRINDILFLYGIGIKYKLNNNINLNFELNSVSTNSDRIDANINANGNFYDKYSLISIGATYKFLEEVKIVTKKPKIKQKSKAEEGFIAQKTIKKKKLEISDSNTVEINKDIFDSIQLIRNKKESGDILKTATAYLKLVKKNSDLINLYINSAIEYANQNITILNNNKNFDEQNKKSLIGEAVVSINIAQILENKLTQQTLEYKKAETEYKEIEKAVKNQLFDKATAKLRKLQLYSENTIDENVMIEETKLTINNFPKLKLIASDSAKIKTKALHKLSIRQKLEAEILGIELSNNNDVNEKKRITNLIEKASKLAVDLETESQENKKKINIYKYESDIIKNKIPSINKTINNIVTISSQKDIKNINFDQTEENTYNMMLEIYSPKTIIEQIKPVETPTPVNEIIAENKKPEEPAKPIEIHTPITKEKNEPKKTEAPITPTVTPKPISVTKTEPQTNPDIYIVPQIDISIERAKTQLINKSKENILSLLTLYKLKADNATTLKDKLFYEKKIKTLNNIKAILQEKEATAKSNLINSNASQNITSTSVDEAFVKNLIIESQNRFKRSNKFREEANLIDIKSEKNKKLKESDNELQLARYKEIQSFEINSLLILNKYSEKLISLEETKKTSKISNNDREVLNKAENEADNNIKLSLEKQTENLTLNLFSTIQTNLKLAEVLNNEALDNLTKVAEQYKSDQITTKPEISKTTNSPISNKTDEVKKDNKKSNIDPRLRDDIEDGYYIVANVYESKQEADKSLEKLKDKGYDAQNLGKPNSKYYMITYSRYDKREEAQMALELIQKKTNPSAWIFEKK